MTTCAKSEILSQYIAALDQQLPVPVPVDFPQESERAINTATVQAATEVSTLLSQHNIGNVVLGSVSTERHLGEAYHGRALHDVDFAIPQQDIEAAKKVLRASGFTAWNEREILETVRNSGGGFGRVHNEGAAAERYINLASGLPIWFGFFGYEQNKHGIAFYEYYTVSRTKVESAALWLQAQDISAHSKATLESLTPLPFDLAALNRLEQTFTEEGESLWTILFTSDINEQDILRRREMGKDDPDELFEIKLTKQFAVSALSYFRTKHIDSNGVALPVFSLEGGYVLMDRYFPHYLGPRKKYTQTSDMIRNSGLLDAVVAKEYQDIFDDRTLTHTPVRTIHFKLDKSQDADTLRRQPHVASVAQNEVFYPALLLEDTHIKRKQPHA